MSFRIFFSAGEARRDDVDLRTGEARRDDVDLRTGEARRDDVDLRTGEARREAVFSKQPLPTIHLYLSGSAKHSALSFRIFFSTGDVRRGDAL